MNLSSEQTSDHPRQARTLPMWLLGAESTPTSSTLTTDRDNCSRSSENSPASTAMADIISCTDASLLPSSSLTTSVVDESKEVDDSHTSPEDKGIANSVNNADSTNIIVTNLNGDSNAKDCEPQSSNRIEESVENSVSSQCTSTTVAAMENPSHSSCSADTSVRRSRPKCLYRQKCYRTNLQHKQEFSHVGDSDYDSETECDSTSKDTAIVKPRCWYGRNCYRKNDDHREKFYHSPSSKNRKRNVAQTNRGNEWNDSDEYDDSFIDDSSSDEFAFTSDAETEVGFSDFDNYDSSDDEGFRGPGKPKKKRFSIF